jgi:predicted house-cleaning noncanonical NTP pyrophosphatase (MazG superfamily)
MIRDTISEIEARLQSSSSLSPEARRELTELLAKLKSEVTELARTHADQAASIAGFAQTSAHEATRSEKNEQLLKLSLEGLSASVEGFEQSHPDLVQIVNRICTTLANLGI